ncbi:Uncharacterised protein [Segatella copri]|nr:Uncharacterised protein [Segatella copri]
MLAVPFFANPVAVATCLPSLSKRMKFSLPVPFTLAEILSTPSL